MTQESIVSGEERNNAACEVITSEIRPQAERAANNADELRTALPTRVGTYDDTQRLGIDWVVYATAAHDHLRKW